MIGNADHYQSLAKDDLNKLINILDACDRHNIPVVLVFLSLPGSRWVQNNYNKDDLRLWLNPEYLEQSAKFWRDVAKNVKNHPAIVAYNILNEPHPERIFNKKLSDISALKPNEISTKINLFYRKIVESIREVDQKTPIIVESTAYADPRAFVKLKPMNDISVIYSFHMYEPFAYTNKKLNNNQFTYPGFIQDLDIQEKSHWNLKRLQDFLNPISTWQSKYNIPSNRILIGEFGGHRATDGLHVYFSDLMRIFNEKEWHWAVYAFREDTWDGMDYEFGNSKIPWQYWEALKKGEKYTLTRYPNSAVFQLLLNAWKAGAD